MAKYYGMADPKKPTKKKRRKVPEDFQISDLPKGASKRSARFYNKGGPGPRDKFRPD